MVYNEKPDPNSLHPYTHTLTFRLTLQSLSYLFKLILTVQAVDTALFRVLKLNIQAWQTGFMQKKYEFWYKVFISACSKYKPDKFFSVFMVHRNVFRIEVMWLYIPALIRFPAVVSVLCHAHGQPPSFNLLWPPTKLIPALFHFQGQTQNEC